MDGLLKRSKRGSYLVSSSVILDETGDVDVGADDMLVNAINQLNRNNRKYVFLDQARVSGFGQLEIVTSRKEKEIQPQLYIRGSISQLDTDHVADTTSADWGRSGSRSSLTGLYYKGYRKLSVVSVDLHLVEFPSRRVIPGASVANSMVVVKSGLSGTASGLINIASLGIPITVDRVESNGQAVRNLIELGVIELLGAHAGVPYWNCLEIQATDARKAQKTEREHRQMTKGEAVWEAQHRLIALGLLNGKATGELDSNTQRAISSFQARENLLPNGQADYDLIARLRKRTGNLEIPPFALGSAQARNDFRRFPKVAERPRTEPVVKTPTSPTATPPRAAAPATQTTGSISKPPEPEQCAVGSRCDVSYTPLYEFLREAGE